MSADPARFVLDSFALLAFFEGETGMERVKAVLKDAEQGRCQVYLSWINLGEVLYITEREQGQLKARETLALIQSFPLQMVEVTPQSIRLRKKLLQEHERRRADRGG